MNTVTILRLPALAALLLSFSFAFAQDEPNAQADVWAVVEAAWNADEKGDKKWIDRMLTDDFVGWGKGSPAPRSKTSTKMWDRFNDSQGRGVAHELYPLSIIVHGDTAVVHYLYSMAYEDKQGKVEISNGRYSDVLIRTGDGWKFLSWHGGKDD
jgi:ketosteroid isomerase-like protein